MNILYARIQALSSLAEAAFDKEEIQDGDQPYTYALSPYYGDILKALLDTTVR